MLERAAQLAELRHMLRSVVATSRGGTVLIRGAAGIGKTTLLRQFGAEVESTARVFWTACAPLFTQRPLAPLMKLADDFRDGLAAQMAFNRDAFDVATALRHELKQSVPCVVVIDDVHWADEATLNVLRLLARGLDTIPMLLALSYREGDIDGGQPLRSVIDELTRADCIATRISLQGLSKASVSRLATPTGVNADQLHNRTAGNPFFVTEVLAAHVGLIPHSVRDAVLARTAAVSSAAQELLKAAAVVPGQIEGRLLSALDPSHVKLDECLRAGILTVSPSGVTFRHELARTMIEESLPPDRRATLHREMLSLLEGNEGTEPDLARLAHHAQASGDTNSVLRYAPAAAELAAAAGAHREATWLLARALQFATSVSPAQRAHLLERFAEESYFATVGVDAIAALREALEIHRSRRDLLAEGRTLRQLGRHLGRNGQNAEAVTAIDAAVTVLERLPPHAELALAYSNLAASYARVLQSEAISWSARAIHLGEQIGCPEAVYTSLNNIGTIEILQGDLAGVAKLERSRLLSEQARDTVGIGRAYYHLCWMLALRRHWDLLDRYLAPAIAHCRDHGQELWLEQLRSMQMEADLASGNWDQAAAAAQALLAAPGPLTTRARCWALLVLARVRARRGQAGCWPLLDEAHDIATRDSVADLRPSVAAARAEAAWLERRPDAVFAEAGTARPLANVDPLASLDLASWQWRAGADTPSAEGLPEPYHMLFTGDRSGASQWWRDNGSPYEAAIAMVGSTEVAELEAAVGLLRGLRARPALGIVSRELRSLGERVARQPRPTTAAHPAGLTNREVDVLNLLASGLRNSEIAACLVVSPRTIDHHVSAILAKLGVRSRAEAITVAARLGLAPSPPLAWPQPGASRCSLHEFPADSRCDAMRNEARAMHARWPGPPLAGRASTASSTRVGFAVQVACQQPKTA